MATAARADDPALPPRAVSLVRLLHPFPSLLVTAVTLALVPLAARHAEASLYWQLGPGMLLFQFSIGVANDVADAQADAVSKPWKALPRGVIGRRPAILLAAAFAAGGLLVTSTLPIDAWLIGAAGLICGLAYDVHLKRTQASWLPWSLAFALVPAWVFRANETWSGLLWWTFPFGAGLGLALNLANQAPDIEGDRAVGVVGMAQRAGEQRARAAALALFGVTAASAAVVLLLTGNPGRAVFAAIDGAFVTFPGRRLPDVLGREALFGLMAAGSGVLAALFISAA